MAAGKSNKTYLHEKHVHIDWLFCILTFPVFLSNGRLKPNSQYIFNIYMEHNNDYSYNIKHCEII